MKMPAIMPPPMGSVKHGCDPSLCGMAVKQRIADKGRHLVMVDSYGRVYVRPMTDARVDLMESRFPKMVVGVFDGRATSKDITEAMVFVYREQLDRSEMTIPQQIVSYLSLKAMSVPQLASLLMKDEPEVSYLVRRLESHKKVRRASTLGMGLHKRAVVMWSAV